MKKTKADNQNRSFFYKIYDRFIKIRETPREIALGLALGVFIGITPTIGVQMPIAIFFAALLKWSKISATFGVFVTNPLTAPFIYSMTYFVGSKILGIKKVFKFTDEMSIETIARMLENAPRIFASLMLGGIILGFPLAVVTYFITYNAVKRYRDNIKLAFLKQKARIVQKRKQRQKKRKRKALKKSKDKKTRLRTKHV